MLDALVQFGVAGLMGLLWVWERMHSRLRERQLSEAHQRLTAQNQALDALMRLVRQNTRAWVGFERSQRRMCELLEGVRHEIVDKAQAA